MHLLLTDRLVCPRCGPAFGLILRADRLEERRVLEGGLGCPNCRATYPVSGGVGDLRPPPRSSPDAADLDLPGVDEERLEVVHALLGVVQGPGHLLLTGTAARFAPGLARRIPEVEAVTVHPAADAWEETAGVSRLRVGPVLPFSPRTFRGVLLERPGGREPLREAARLLGGEGRVVVLEADGETAGHLMAAGLTVQLDDQGVVVAGR